MKDENFTERLVAFLSGSPTGFHAVENVAERLKTAGFSLLSDRDSIRTNKPFFLKTGGAVIAVRPGTAHPADAGFRIAAAHTDSPGLRLKVSGAHEATGGIWAPVEVYGGPILSTWLDRELVFAGRAVVYDEGTTAADYTILPFRSERAVAIIPNLAIHLNRDINKGFEYNAQDHMQARLALSADATLTAEMQIKQHVADCLGVSAEAVGTIEAYLVDPAPAVLLEDGNSLVSGRVDNLAGCFSCLDGFLEAVVSGPTQVLCLFDNEEIGSRTGSGADSPMLDSVLRRLSISDDDEAWYRAVAASFIVSNDGAHALHDMYTGKYDASYAPVLGGGPVLKVNSQYRYATTLLSMERTRQAARTEDIPLQMLAGRSDMRTGSTIGPISWTRTGISTVDVGVPMLAMHSIREVCDVRDVDALSGLVRSLLESE